MSKNSAFERIAFEIIKGRIQTRLNELIDSQPNNADADHIISVVLDGLNQTVEDALNDAVNSSSVNITMAKNKAE